MAQSAEVESTLDQQPSIELPDLVVPPLGPPRPDVPIRDVVSRALMIDLRRMVHHEPGTRQGEDVEELHQMRVATRRLRATLRTYRPVLDEQWARDLGAALRPLADVLGAVRDLDVMAEQVDDDLRDLSSVTVVDDSAAEVLRGRVADRRREAREALLVHLNDPAHMILLDRLRDAATNPVCVDPNAPAGPTLSPLVGAAWRRVRKAEKRSRRSEGQPGEGLHLVRLRIKRLRYAADAVAPAYGKAATRLSKVAARAQDVLGIVQDANVAVDAYQRMVPRADPPTAYLLGLLAARALGRKDAAMADWPDAWRALGKPRLRAFLDA